MELYTPLNSLLGNPLVGSNKLVYKGCFTILAFDHVFASTAKQAIIKPALFIQPTYRLLVQAYVLTIVNTHFRSLFFLSTCIAFHPLRDNQEAEILFPLIFWHN